MTSVVLDDATTFSQETPQNVCGYWQVTSGKPRPDNRQFAEARPFVMHRSILSRPDGSIQLSCGNTCVIASVNGPLPCQKPREHEDKATIEVNVKLLQTTSTKNSDHILSLNLCKTFENVVAVSLFPRSLISFTVQIVRDDGGLYAAAINACMIAALQAGLPCSKTIVAAAVCLLESEHGSQVAVDPTLKEEFDSKTLMTIAYTTEPQSVDVGQPDENVKSEDTPALLNKQDIMMTTTTGIWPVTSFFHAKQLAHNVAQQYIDLIRSNLQQ